VHSQPTLLDRSLCASPSPITSSLFFGDVWAKVEVEAKQHSGSRDSDLPHLP
jgi:hypothetical protein